MRAILVIFFLVSSLNTAFAEESFPPGDFTELRQSGKFSVTKVIAPDTVELSDGRLIHLVGLDFPDLYGENGPGPFAETAMKVVNDMLLGHPVRLHQTQDKSKGRINRMRHHMGHLERTSDGAWVQGTLVALGLARVRTTLSNPEMAPQMLILEMDAREQKLGIWADPQYEVLDAAIIPTEKLNRYQIIEGTVDSASLKKNRIYLNFGEDWREDFTVTISGMNRRNFTKQNIDPLSWNSKKLRIRGWLEFYNGPNLEIDHPERVEVLE